MLRKADEAHFHTSEDVSGYLADALDVLHRFELDPTKHDATLGQLVALLGAKQVTFENVGVNNLGLLR